LRPIFLHKRLQTRSPLLLLVLHQWHTAWNHASHLLLLLLLVVVVGVVCCHVIDMLVERHWNGVLSGAKSWRWDWITVWYMSKLPVIWVLTLLNGSTPINVFLFVLFWLDAASSTYFFAWFAFASSHFFDFYLLMLTFSGLTGRIILLDILIWLLLYFDVDAVVLNIINLWIRSFSNFSWWLTLCICIQILSCFFIHRVNVVVIVSNHLMVNLWSLIMCFYLNLLLHLLLDLIVFFHFNWLLNVNL